MTHRVLITMTPAVLAQLDAVATAKNQNRSGAVRLLIAEAFAALPAAKPIDAAKAARQAQRAMDQAEKAEARRVRRALQAAQSAVDVKTHALLGRRQELVKLENSLNSPYPIIQADLDAYTLAQRAVVAAMGTLEKALIIQTTHPSLTDILPPKVRAKALITLAKLERELATVEGNHATLREMFAQQVVHG